MNAQEVLALIAANGSAMSVLDSPSCYIEAARPPKVHEAGTTVAGIKLDGSLVLDPDGRPVDEGEPAKTLGDLVREALAG